MKLAWFTPFNQRSAIAQCSKIIVDEMSRHCDVDLWVPGDGELIQTDRKVVRFDSVSDALIELKTYDYCIFNMGNHFDFHADIYKIMQARAGIVILHDLIMHHFFVDYYMRHMRDTDAYVSEMERAYGVAGRDVALQSTLGATTPVWMGDDVARFPLFEGIVDRAEGVFVHSNFHRATVEKKYIGDIGTAYLPYQTTTPTRQRSQLLQEFGIAGDKIVAISSGIVHPLKRIERVLAVIKAKPALAQHLVYVVVGDENEEYRAELQGLVDEYGIAESVRFLGYQPADILRDFLAAADFAINLRFPNSEGCSLSLIEQMSFGNAVIAIDSGMYREMPNTAVIKVPVNDTEHELSAALQTLVFDDRVRRHMGECAAVFARENFSAERYARELLEYLSRKNFLSTQPIRAALLEISTALSHAPHLFEDSTLIHPLIQEFYSIVNGRAAHAHEDASL